MIFKYVLLFISGSMLCLMIIGASAQTADEDRQAVIADQKALDDDYRQLQQDQSVGNAAGVEVDQDNIMTAEQDFRADIERAIAGDQENISADQRALDLLSGKQHQDIRANPDAVVADQRDIGAAERRLQADNAQLVADDTLQVTCAQQALYNESQQLQRDLRGADYAVGGVDTVRADRQDIQQARDVLQEAQVKLQFDRNLQPVH